MTHNNVKVQALQMNYREYTFSIVPYIEIYVLEAYFLKRILFFDIIHDAPFPYMIYLCFSNLQLRIL